MGRKYFIETFGCQMNFHDSERLAGLLEAEGYEPAGSETAADLVVLNTCSVREKAVEKVYSRLGEIREAAREAGVRPTVAVTGCVAQQEGERLLKRGAGIDVVVGTQSLKRLPTLVEEARQARRRRIDINPYEDVSFPLGLVRHSDPVRAWVTIIEGCNEFCAFCVVPYTRGHERMRPVADILAEVRVAAESGRREVQLLGQIVNHYQAPDDPACDFAELLERVSQVPGIERIRFASPHPRHVSDRLIDVMRHNPKICRHLHLPVQSGSTRILKAMRRRHTREDYLALVARLRENMPDIALSTDLIVGFPGETEADFEETLSLVREVDYHYLFSFKYSPRPNTLATKRMRDDVPEAEKTRRIMALQTLQRELQYARHQRAVGTVEEVLVDSVSRRRESELAGRTSGSIVVNFPGPREWIGRLVPVRIVEAGPNSLRGEAVGAAPDGRQ
ncbi:MAG: tRNA (N6-isopentenyl adenosine(37)-C2)-methylthiotransferase MiaB [Acidobacteriota bacterium]|nr:MAG: tRNA (N6-isopentenyl adenosine(37)-C2)-methylthiotransferase MiaB [Acidobacteriota bacterium]